MNTPILSSTFLLTSLMFVGLFFFIRASVKDRTQIMTFALEPQSAPAIDRLNAYFLQRAYQVITVDLEQNRTTYEGIVRPSLFLAIFLTLLAGVGALCLSLVVLMLIPKASAIAFLPIVLAPLAGFFYWRKAKRPEQVVLKVDQQATDSSLNSSLIIQVSAHRDELIELQRALNLKPVE
jgi:Cofactor assembly of complex C subunit B